MILYYTEAEGGRWRHLNFALPKTEFIVKVGDIHNLARLGKLPSFPNGFHSALIAPGARWDEVNRTWVNNKDHRRHWRWLRRRDR